MMKEFNITGTCFPDKHYMVDISDRVAQIKKLVDGNKYFCVNRGRQYGKTTMLNCAAQTLSEDYVVIFVSFEGFSDNLFESAERLGYAFLSKLFFALRYGMIKNLSADMINLINRYYESSQNSGKIGIEHLSLFISDFCSLAKRAVVLIIDEVDKASNYKSFIDFLGLLREKFLVRELAPTFRSVILSGVYDVKNLKLKIRPEAEHSYNSPWNIAVPFDVDMSFSVADVEGMLREYEQDQKTGMDVHEIAQCIIDYTSGYPFLVSKICKTIDETDKNWRREGVLEAVRALLHEKNTLFDDMNKKLSDFPQLRYMLKDILFSGVDYTFNPDDKYTELGALFQYIQDDHGKIKVSNRIFEIRLYNAFAAEEEIEEKRENKSSIGREGEKV